MRVAIPKQAGVGEIADILADRGVISNATLFELRATLGGDRGDLKPGIYELRKDMTYGDAIDALVTGPSRRDHPAHDPGGPQPPRDRAARGARRRARRLPARERRRTSLIDAREYGLPSDPESLEGFLFPATYELRRGAPAPDARAPPARRLPTTTSRRSTCPTRAART